MKNILKILALLLLVVCFSCEELRTFDCSNCQDTKPVEAFIDIRLEPTMGEAPDYTVRIYRGKIEDNILVEEVNASDSFRVRGRINQEYSAIATRVVDGIEYNIIDSTIPEVIDRSDYCESTCYMVTDKEIDLRIKYY